MRTKPPNPEKRSTIDLCQLASYDARRKAWDPCGKLVYDPVREIAFVQFTAGFLGPFSGFYDGVLVEAPYVKGRIGSFKKVPYKDKNLFCRYGNIYSEQDATGRTVYKGVLRYMPYEALINGRLTCPVFDDEE